MQKSLIVALAVTLTGCGVTWGPNPQSINLAPPPSLKNSINADLYRFDLGAIIGTIAIRNKDTGSIQAVDQFIVDAANDRSKLTVQQVNARKYHSIVTGTMKTDVKAVAVAAEAAGAGSVELTIDDELYASVPFYYTTALYERGQKWSVKANEELVYVTSGYLRRATSSAMAEISTSASGLAGPAVGYNGKVYSKSDVVRHDYYMDLAYIELARVKDLQPGVVPPQSNDVRSIQPPAASAPQPTPAISKP